MAGVDLKVCMLPGGSAHMLTNTCITHTRFVKHVNKRNDKNPQKFFTLISLLKHVAK